MLGFGRGSDSYCHFNLGFGVNDLTGGNGGEGELSIDLVIYVAGLSHG